MEGSSHSPTDCFGEFPKHAPAGMQVVWLVTTGGGPTPWGERVELGDVT